MTSFFNPSRFYGGFDPRLPGIIHLTDSSHLFSTQARQRIERDLQRRSYRWNPDDLAFALYESAYVHEAVHLLQHTTCPSMMPIFGLRSKINLHGSIALSNFGPAAHEKIRAVDGKSLFPVPMLKWLKAPSAKREHMITEAIEEFTLLGAPDHAHPFYINAYRAIPQLTMDSVLAERQAALHPKKGTTLAGLWHLLGTHYLMLEELYQTDGVALVSEAGAVSAQIAFVCKKMGPEAAVAVADTLTSSSAYSGLSDFLWRFASRSSPTVDQFLAAYVSATWCLQGLPGRDLSPATRFDILNSQDAIRSFAGYTPTTIFTMLSEGMQEPTFSQTLGEGYNQLLDELESDQNLIEDTEQDFSWPGKTNFIAYGATAADLCRSGINTVLEHADQVFAADFLLGNTQWTLDNRITIQAPTEISRYRAIADWMDADKGISVGAVPAHQVESLLEIYTGACLIDALMLGDQVNPLPLGDSYIHSSLDSIGCRRVGI